MPELTDRAGQARERLASAGQDHLLRFVDELPTDRAEALLDQIESLDLARLAGMIRGVLSDAHDVDHGELQPPQVIGVPRDAAAAERDARAAAAGEELLRAGKAAAFLVAGGQGTRLGFDGPKGRFPVGPLTNRSLFAYHAQRVLATCRRYAVQLPYYVMTSRANDADTRAAFEEAGWFGLSPDQVMFLVQGMLPAVDADGRILLEDKHLLSMSPDGHGGCFGALQASGALDDMAARGIEQIFYFQVDNPLAQVFDPVFLGHHVLAHSEMSTKVVEKTRPGEKVGVLATRDGRTCLVEYSDLDAQLAAARDDAGQLRYRAGNIAIHVLELAFVRRLLEGGGQLPVHRAHKKVAHVGAAGQRVEPDEPNAFKMEMFVFDALPLARSTVIQEVRRDDEFAPVKNAEGEDSPATARAALVDQARRWMAAAGLALPAGPVEVGPLFALDQQAFLDNLTRADYGPVFDRS